MSASEPDAHWNTVYAAKDVDDVSWYEPVPATSRRLITMAATSGRVIDVGAGASGLADALLPAGYDVTVLDVSSNALEQVRQRLGQKATYVVADVLTWTPVDSYAVWHDRAVFHFLTDPADQARYVNQATTAVQTGGGLVMGTFAPTGPESCSGLPTARHDADSLVRLFAGAFTLEHAETDEHVTPWGVIQPFTWVVLRRE
ncbi:class I SAM-dependent methyltransferase [Nocardioides sp.]|uniref:class I SAM-dependent methyltransferase n=1 Tax=Nocardioides sp. TaxID=35761 RepID=UPI00198563A7|nr:class I SAM-dependent methyltransferase [Nocardioides sp.]MBC7275688.1 class I SAM-dependent methyltransferase [Nocardioides sp.]